MPHHPPEWPAKNNPEMMTVEDVARRLNVSDSFVYGAVSDGRLKHHRLGKGQGGIRVSEEQLAAFLRLTERGGEEPDSKLAPKPSGNQFSFLKPP
ncbi:MAG TPA: helix-turn-helix domain-containing protein [Urbifossiella sp.]|nr:helix-turn-helix domain-containing protein [Urbifossiella sp.]